MKRSKIITTILMVNIMLSCTTNLKSSYRLLDAHSPQLEAKVFANGIISKDKRFEQSCSFSPDGKNFYFSYTDGEWKKSTIIQLSVSNPSQQDTLAITKSDYQSGQFIDASGKNIYVSSLLQTGAIWHADIYTAKRTGEKSWDEPQQLSDPVNSIMCEWHPTLTDKGIMYFASERGSDHSNADIYKAIPKGDNYIVEKLNTPVNTKYNETDPLIAPDESFLIFASNRPNGISEGDMYLKDNGYEELDLYICFNKGNNTWTTPKNMGKGINSSAWEFAPALSPDQKYLFFTRRKAFKTTEPSKIYWISSQIINQLKD